MALTYTAIATVEVGATVAANIDFQNIPQIYSDLVILVSLRTDRTGESVDSVYPTFNNDTTMANYSGRRLRGSGAAADSDTYYKGVLHVDAPNSTANTFGNAIIYIPNYTSSNQKSFSVDAVQENNTTSGVYVVLSAGLWTGTSAISRVTLQSDTAGSDFVQYSSATLYGIKNTV